MEKKAYIANTDEEMRMVFDPYRLRIIYTVTNSDEPLTVKMIAEKLEEPANKVHYHVKKLFDFGYFELVKTENINGIIAKYYTNAYVGPFFGTATKELPEMTKYLRGLLGTMDLISNDFKNDIITYSHLLEKEGKDFKGLLNLDRVVLYMTHEEALQAARDVVNILNKYTKADETKQIYTTVQTIARIK